MSLRTSKSVACTRYIEIRKNMNKAKNKLKDVGSAVKRFLEKIWDKILNVFHSLKPANRKKKKLTKAEKQANRRDRNNGILGIGLFLVVLSIAYSTAVVAIGVGTTESYIALAPQALFALITLIVAFIKLLK